MFGSRKKVWDMVGDIEEARSRSFAHLSALAKSVIHETVGISPQDAAHDEEMENYRMRLTAWERDQEVVRTMSDSEYRQAAERGLLRRPEPPVRKEASAEQLDEWLRKTISARLTHRIDNLIFDLMGLESDSWNNKVRVKSGDRSPIFEVLSKKAKAFAEEWATDWVAKHDLKETYKNMKVEEMEYRFRHDLENATKKAIADRIAVMAKERAEQVQKEVLAAAVDQAMFEMFPVLRRMDAASRLDAKPEKKDAA